MMNGDVSFGDSEELLITKLLPSKCAKKKPQKIKTIRKKEELKKPH